MKLVCALPALAVLAGVQGATLRGHLDMTPVVRVLNLIRELKVSVEYDGKVEQKTYDKFACWCEATLERKAKDISNAKELIEKLGEHILKLKGDIGSHGAEVASLNKWIAENQAAQKDAHENRDRQNAEFETEKLETEQCIGALDGAIKTLTGAGEGKGAGFLELREAQLMSAAQSLRKVLSHAAATESTSTDDLKLVSSFLEKPMNFAAAQTGRRSPFGEYAPASTQLQGILKGMYDAFVAQLEKSNGEESNSQKAHEEYIATKQNELTSLQENLEAQEMGKASKSKDESDSQKLRDDTKEQLSADEDYFESTKQGCRAKAVEWNERSRLRSEELVGINKAIAILESPESMQVFQGDAESNDTTTDAIFFGRRVNFLQLKRVASNAAGQDKNSIAYQLRTRAWTHLARLAAKYGNFNLAQIATELQAGGHFDKVIKMMDDMIVVLRKEEQSDIRHRDRCQNGISKNNADIADARKNMQTATATVNEMTDKVKALEEEIKELERLMGQTQTDMDEKLAMRNKEREYFEESIKDNVQAINVINRAMKSLMAYHEKHPSALLQQGPGPEYTVDSDKAPDVAERKDRSKQTSGIVTILQVIVTDIENDVATARKEDEENQKEYERENAELKDLLHAQKAGVVAAEETIADAENNMNNAKAFHLQNQEELNVQNALQVTLNSDCDWVANEFDSRRQARKAEIDGLQNAKAILAGAAAGSSGAMDELAIDAAR